MRNTKKLLRNLDWTFVALTLLLLAYNVIILSSASSNVLSSDPNFYVRRQLIWIGAGFAAGIVIACFDYRRFSKLSWVIYAIANLLLIAVLFTPEKKEAHRWFDLKFMDFQPSELAKLVIIIAFACFLYQRRDKLGRFYNWLFALAYVGLPALLILREPDLGTALVFVVLFLVMCWIGGMPGRFVVTLLLLIILGIALLFGTLYVATDGYQHLPEEVPAFLPLKLYQATRLVIFINPYMDPLGAGYNMIQSEVAIGSGGLWGQGYGQGSQVQGYFLPEHHTDFIFSVVGEEFGFVGAIALIILYLLLLLRAIYIAITAKDHLGSTMVAGVAAMLAFQVFTNAGMTVGIMPITGIPLPLLSYGGSGMLVNLMSFALVVNVSMRRGKDHFFIEE